MQKREKIHVLGLGPKAIDPKLVALERKLKGSEEERVRLVLHTKAMCRMFKEREEELKEHLRVARERTEDMKSIATGYAMVACGGVIATLVLTVLWLMK